MDCSCRKQSGHYAVALNRCQEREDVVGLVAVRAVQISGALACKLHVGRGR